MLRVLTPSPPRALLSASGVLLKLTKTITHASDPQTHVFSKDLSFFPNFLSIAEQRILAVAALQKLDDAESRKFRRRRKDFLENASSYNVFSQSSGSLQGVFLPDELYDFEQGHYDGVIRNFREMHVSSWPTPDIPGLEPLLERIRKLHPDEPTQTHVLHLASDGEILPHVDNIEASGSWILGVSLGSARLMKLQSIENPQDSYELCLPSGSVYLQRDVLRYEFKHSIPKGSGGQRLSIMIRVESPFIKEISFEQRDELIPSSSPLVSAE